MSPYGYNRAPVIETDNMQPAANNFGGSSFASSKSFRSKQRMKQGVKRFLLESACTGFSDLVRAKGLAPRIIWLLCIIFCLGIGIYEVVMVTLEYYKNPTSTVLTLVSRDSLPSLTICPQYWINKTKVDQLQISNATLFYALSLLPKSFQELMRPRRNELRMASSGPAHRLSHSDKEAFLATMNTLNFGTNISAFLNAISIDVDNLARPRRRNDTVKVIGGQGICFKVSMKDPQKHLDDDLSSQDIYLKRPQYSRYDWPWDEHDLTRGSRAAFVRVGYNITPFKILTRRNDPIVAIEENTYTTLHIRQTRISRLDNPRTKSRCDTDGTLAYCRSKCSMQPKALAILGGCHIMLTQGQEDTDYANLCDALSVTNEQLRRYVRVISDCAEKRCHRPCEETIFETVKTEDSLPSASNPEFVAAVQLQIADYYQLMSEFPTYSFETWISNLGGQLGLWLGVSAISFLQTFYLFWLICTSRASQRHTGEPSNGNVSAHTATGTTTTTGPSGTGTNANTTV